MIILTPTTAAHVETQDVISLIQLAEKQGYEILRCSNCSGPAVRSHERPATKCFRCGRFEEGGEVALPVKTHRCKRCKKTFKSVVNWSFCDICKIARKKMGLGSK